MPAHVSDRLPPTFATAGNADALLPQSLTMAATLTANCVVLSTPAVTRPAGPVYDNDHQPALVTKPI